MDDATPRPEYQLPAAGQRVYVNLLFADLCDYTALNEEVDPEIADALRRQLEALANRAIRRHGGSISQVYGDGLLAVFGLPSPREDDARRTVEAALELHEITRRTRWQVEIPPGFEVRIHSGIHCGLVFARPGDPLHGRFDLSGDAVNTAARLCAAAGRDELLVSGAVLRGMEPMFLMQPAFELLLKGKKLPTIVNRVTGRSSVRSRFEASSRRGLTEFINRTEEQRELRAALQESLAGRGRLVLVTGPAGIGKTRLLGEFAKHARDAQVRVLRGYCDSYGEIAPLEPFVQILRQVFDIHANQPSHEARQDIETQLARWGVPAAANGGTFARLLSLAPWPSDAGDAEASTFAITQAIATLIATLAAQTPIALILDDWQWADDASRAVLAHISRSLRGLRGCIVIGQRGSDQLDPALQPDDVLTLSPFKERESRAAIAALRPEALDLGVTGALHQRSGGNPLFLEELCRALSRTALSNEDVLAAGQVPSTVQGVIQARVAALPFSDAQVLRAASVIGIEFTHALLAEIQEDDHLEAALDSLCQNDLIYAGDVPGTYRFNHGITREVVYDSVLMSERRRMHRAAAHAFERGFVAGESAHAAETLAYHHRGAGDHDKAARYAEQAGDRGMVTSSLDRARFHYAAALADVDELPPSRDVTRRWLAISHKWALPFVYSPSRDQLATLHRAAAHARELEDPSEHGQSCHWLGWAHYTLGDYAQSIEYYSQAIELAEQSNRPRLVAQLWSTLGQSYGAAGEYTRALESMERGLDLKRMRGRGRTSSSVAAGFVYALGCQALVHGDLGDFARAESDFFEALEMVRGSGHAIEGSVLGLQCMVQLWQGRWEDAANTAARNRRTAERTNSAYSFAMSLGFEAYAHWALRRSSDAIARLRRAIDWLEASGLGLFSSFNYGCLANALLESGEPELARTYAERALARASCRDPLGETQAHRVLAELAAARGGEARDELARHLSEAVRSAQVRNSRHDLAKTQLLAAEVFASQGAAERARVTASEALAAFDDMGMPYYAARARALTERS
jgi:class 3 adenylate cyclase/tetratricopeptide (TPR) repeat protein